MAQGPVVGLGIQATGLKEIAKDLRGGDAELRRGFRNALKQGAEVVAVEYRRRISPYSKRIPPTIKTGVRASSAFVKAGGANAPHAGPLENLGKDGTFRHPVFGHRDRWVSQKAHPAALPALEAAADEAAEAAANALSEWARSAGFS